MDALRCCSGIHSTANGREHCVARVGLAEEAGASRALGLRADFRRFVRCDEDDGRLITSRDEFLVQFEARHAIELNIEHDAVEVVMLRISEKFFR